MLLLGRSLVVRSPPARLLRDFSSWVKRLDSTETFLQNTVSLLDKRPNILDECFFVELVLFLVSLRTGEVLWRDDVSVTT